MLNATSALRKASESGEPLPPIPALHRLTENRVLFRFGQLVMIGARPNAGKSTFAQWLAAEWNLDTLYFSADQDAHTTVVKLASAMTGHKGYEIEQHLGADDSGGAFYEDALTASNIQFVFDSNPSVEDMVHEVHAYVEMFDQYPQVIVVDNLLNVQDSGELAVDQWIVGELHALARETGALVLLLVHATEATKREPHMPSAMKEILNKLAQLPDMVLTVALSDENNEFRIAAVKTRGTKADPMAKSPYLLGSDFSRCAFFPSPYSRDGRSW